MLEAAASNRRANSGILTHSYVIYTSWSLPRTISEGIMAVIHLINPYDGTAMGSMQGVGGRQVPLGLAYIAATLREDGHDVMITDEVIMQDGLKAVSSKVPDAILLSVYPSSMNRARSIVKRARSLNPKTLVIAGGAIAQATTAESYMLDLDADVIVLGEGRA